MDTIEKNGVIGVLVAFIATIGVVVALLLMMPEKPHHLENGQICLPDTDSIAVLNERIQEVVTKMVDNIEDGFRRQRRFIKLIGTEMQTKGRGDSGGDMTTITDWKCDKDMFRGNGVGQMEYKNGHVEVPVDGQYFVHSYIQFTIPSAVSVSMSYDRALAITIKLSIVHQDKLKRKDMEIATDVQIYSVTGNESWDQKHNYQGSDVSSLVKMNAGDAISIKLNNITFLVNSESNEFVVRLVQHM